MASQLDYFLVRDQQAALARRAERAWRSANGDPPEGGSRLGRVISRLARRSEQRELPLTPRRVERAPIAGRRLESE
jgi:hypothetical protein